MTECRDEQDLLMRIRDPLIGEPEVVVPPVGPARELDQIDWEAQPWDENIPQLLRYATILLSRRNWRAHLLDDGESNWQPQDFVQQAIEKTLCGQRRWYRDRVSLLHHLAGVVRSEISHDRESFSVRSRLSRENESLSNPTYADHLNQESLCVWQSELRHFLRFLGKKDPLLSKLAMLMIVHGIQKTFELSQELDVPVTGVRNLRKRLNRACTDFRLQGGA